MIESDDHEQGMPAWMKKDQLLSQQVKIDGDHILINVAYEYGVPLNECATAERILHWVWHLAEKTWMTQDISRKFIEIACKHHGIKYT
ncbi:hypothetical protein LZU96_15225 [Pantoea agglomerans]|uniref:hypothetical protein n=1 Tax=Enterobacter agglomerans TaxID=549 RepID=UPI001F2C0B4D|nr:hypothetical protein [Pantoea agglomerans]UIL51569.1 hypothetical protein LZU96_15225 [Pantoea agglomerans]